MRPIDLALIALASAAVLYGLLVTRALWRWVRECRRCRITIAYKRKVQMQAPLDEWLGWAKMLAADEASRGRVVYLNRGVTVAILRPRPPGRIARAALRRQRRQADAKAAA